MTIRSFFVSLLPALLILSASAKPPSRVNDNLKPTSTNSAAYNRHADFINKMKGCTVLAPDSMGAYADSLFFTGYEKTSSADYESFLIHNHTPYFVAGVLIEITYFSTDGRMLHRRTSEIPCFIPPHETRKSDLRSFDPQHSYHYVESSAGRNGAFPYKVTLRTLSLWLRPDN